jgi:GlcNAc-PI de-N-acetylase
MVGLRSAERWANPPDASVSGARKIRLSIVLPLSLALLMILTGMTAGRTSALGSCSPGWSLVGQYDTDFTWTSLLSGSVAWVGYVQVLENFDVNCNVLGVIVAYTGSPSGGTLSVTGSPFVSFTVQYPHPFSDYANVAQNAVGQLGMANPSPGNYLTYAVSVNRNINANGADEYVIQGGGGTALVTDIKAAFSLPLSLLGSTIYAEMQVGRDLCTCSEQGIVLPGQSATPPPPPPPTSVWDVYVHAHEDDWQLFLAPNAYYDYHRGDHLLFIYATAGDAGLGPSWWQPREDAAKASVRQLAGSNLSESASSVVVCHSTPQVCHNVTAWTYGSSVSIFMRLPDGNPQGTGYAATGFQSMSRLRDGQISNITTVDGSATYSSWADLYLSLNSIITTYTPYNSSTWINAPDFDRGRQTSQGTTCPACPDHADHLAVADAVHNITIGMGAPWSRAWFIDYPIGNADPRYPPNLGPGDYAIKKQAFDAYNNVMIARTGSDAYTQQPDFLNNCFQRTYFVVV